MWSLELAAPSEEAIRFIDPSAGQKPGVFDAMREAILGSSPPGLPFLLARDRLDGNVDDGSGPGRLYVDVTVPPRDAGTIGPLPQGSVSQGSLSTPEVTRPEPLYTVEELELLIRAVDERTQGCIRRSCR
jgi:hypothetical protein